MVIDTGYYGLMPYKDKEKQKAYEKARGVTRRTYFRERARKISKTNGSDYLPPNVEFPYNASCNGVGRIGEVAFLEKFSSAKWLGKPCDGECLLGKVDIKTSKPIRKNTGRERWQFHLTRQRGIVDSFVLFCLDHDSNISKVLVVPDKEINAKDITIMTDGRSKYNKYAINL